jgi:pimeloyl-ACP methyl ester carboxylesterase
VTAETTLVVDGLRTKARVSGEGPALLLIGGLWTQVGLWENLLGYFDGFRTVAFDPPGIGGTDMPRRPYDIRRLAQFAVAVLDSLDVASAHVLGVSHGGVVAQQLARSFPERVDRLVLVSTGFGAPGLPGRPDALLRFLRPGAYLSADALEQHAGTMFGGRLREQPQLVRQWRLKPPGSLRAYAYRLAGTAGWSSLPWLHRLSCPTLVVHGDDDPIVPPVNARVLARRIPGARYHVVEGGGHLLVLDSTADVLPHVTTFLQTQAGSNP